MATRKSEWLASIKPILDRDEAKKDAAALAKELGDILEVKVDASPENLSDLTKEFNAQLKTMGKQPIVFSEKTLSGIVSQFANAVVQGISAGVSQVDFRAQLEELNKKREKIVKAKNRANQVMKSRTRMTRLENFNINTASPLPIDGDVAKEAQQLVDVLYDSADKIDQAAEKYGKSSTYYINAVMDAQEAYNKYLRMQKTFGQMSSSQLATIPKDVKALYAKLGTDREKYENSGGINIPFDETLEAGKIFDSFEDLSDAFENIVDNADKYDKMLVQIDAKIEEITRKARESGGVEDGIFKGAKDGLKTLNEIEAAYKRLKVDKGTKLRQQNESHIKSALDFDPANNNVGIKTFAKDYYDAAASGDWVEEYHALLRYVRLYESYLTSTNKTHQNKVTAKNNPFTPLYEQLKPMAENAQNMLQNILNMSEGKALVGMGGNASAGPTPEDVVNAQKIREEAEAKVNAEREALELARRRREEEEKLAKAAEKKRIADDAATEARKEEFGLMQAMEKFQGAFEKTDRKNETLAFVNTQTGDMSDMVVGGAHGVTTEAGTSRKMSELGYDMEVHSHSWKTAVPSVEDFEEWSNQLEYIKKFGIRAGEELLAFDFSKLDPAELQKIIQKYKDLDEKISTQVKSMSLDEKLGKFGSYQGIQEGVQVMLRQGLEQILQDIPGIRKSIKMPELPVSSVYNEPKQKSKGSDIRSLDDVFTNANEEVKELIKNYAILAQKGSELTDDEYDRFIEIGDKLEEVAPDAFLAPASQWQSFGENVITAERAVDGLNESLEKNHQLTSGDDTRAGVGDASLADLEAERAKAEALQDELDHKIGALQAAHDEKEMLQSDLNVANEQIKIAQDSEVAARARADETDLKLIEKDKHIQDLEEQLAQAQTGDGDALFAAEQRAHEAEERAYMYDRAMTSMQEEMADLRGKLADAKTVEGKYESVNSEELKNVLNSIVYNVKIAHDDNDKTANKIALDDSTLEATLTKVFSNILNPQTQQNDSEQVEKHWALESTLQTVKGVLDNIHTNTTKIGSLNTSNVDMIDDTALDSRLTEIKSVLESIDKKIAKGGVIATRGAVKQANAQPIESEAKTQAARSNMLKSLINDYKTLGKLSAQFANDGNLETQAMLKNLKEEIARKRQSLNITMDENRSLREKYSIAFDAEKRLLDAAKAQAKINEDNRDDKTAWKKKVKDAQRATGVNAATTAANSGDQTVMRAIGTEGVSKDIENKAKELSDQIKTLRMLRDEIDKKGTQASDGDRDNLSKQIAKVKALKTEVDSYLKIHEKYSGEGVTDLGDASNFGAVGTDQYWNNITAAIKKASSGKTTIKGLNADTGELTGTTKIAANTFATWSATVDPLTGRLSMLRTGIKKTETIIEQITRKTKEIFTYFSGSSIIFKAFNELKKGVQYVRDIDLALTELKKVTDATEETYDKFLKTAAKTADKVGSTIQKVVSSTADWARLGYSMKEAAEFAESTQILMNVSEFTDVSQATDTLISSVQAFGYTAETSMDVVDLLNTIGKQNCRNYIVIYS